jgi:uncharacterized membrane protein YqjE
MIGYAELVAEDLEQTNRDLGARLVAAAVLGVSLFFVIFCACLMVVAMTWDTPHRLSAIGWMFGAFVVVAIIAARYRSGMLREQAPFLATVRREWREDRVILERILSPDEH